MRIPRLVISGATSGVGKTTITAGLIAALRRRGKAVQPFKCGPDYIDPSYHTLAAGLSCRNIDTWMVPRDAVLQLFACACRTADIAIIEGVMGLYDGRAYGEDGSTAEIAKLLDAPVILVVNAASTARSAGALALGYKNFDPNVRLAGFILNGIGSPNHLTWAKQSIEDATGLPVLGHLPRNERMHLPERHLGLVPTSENLAARESISRIREQVEATVDVEAILQLASDTKPIDVPSSVQLFPQCEQQPKVRLGVAEDEAFSFYYRDNLDLLQAWGAELVPVSPLRDRALPEVDGLYIGGGFPEMYAAQLSANHAFRRSLLRAARAGMPVYAECGGLMFLSEGIIDFEGKKQEMVGIVPGWTSMQKKKARMGYVYAEVIADNLLAQKGQVLRGHEFHWSRRIEGIEQAAYRVLSGALTGTSETSGERYEGFAKGNILASYIHLHFGYDPMLARRFIAACQAWR